MASSKSVSVSKAKLAEAGEEMEVAGAAGRRGGRGRSGLRARSTEGGERQPPRSAWPKSLPERAI